MQRNVAPGTWSQICNIQHLKQCKLGSSTYDFADCSCVHPKSVHISCAHTWMLLSSLLHPYLQLYMYMLLLPYLLLHPYLLLRLVSAGLVVLCRLVSLSGMRSTSTWWCRATRTNSCASTTAASTSGLPQTPLLRLY